MITYTCPHCGERIAAPDGDAGELYLCDSCSQSSIVPAVAHTHSQSKPRRTSSRVLRRGPAPGAEFDAVDAASIGCCLLGCLDFGCTFGGLVALLAVTIIGCCARWW